MSTEKETILANWKHPDELIKLHRLKQRKKQLAARLNHNNNNNNSKNVSETDKTLLLESKLSQKRKNPFAKSTDNLDNKKIKTDATSLPSVGDEEDSLLSFVRDTPTRPPPAKLVLQPFDARAFSKLLHHSSGTAGDDDEDAGLENQKFTKHLPMDWSLKTRVRFFCRSELPATTLKTSQMASGLTSFVRCIDTQNSCCGLDISPATRFNQGTFYWQHPHLPWMTLFPRNSKENNGITLGERERKALAEDWDHSFRGLFQLLRARQCPYFYLCANTFTVLFRAAGTGGCVETHALMVPTTRGMRSALRQEGIEYTMPLKKDGNLNRSGDEESNAANDVGKENNDKEDSFKNSSDNATKESHSDLDNDDDDQEEDDWLESLGVDEKEIRKIKSAHSRKIQAKEMADDFSDNSLLLIEGVECQGFFSFLLNAKSTISSVGRLAGVPPTLLAPVAFPKATMQHLTTRSSKVRMDGVDYCSIETKGIVLPTFLPYVCNLLGETKETFSATLASSSNTWAFSKATQRLLEQSNQTDGAQEKEMPVDGEQVFGQENLSDCGLLPNVIESMCRTGQNAVGLLERVCYDKTYGYAWS